MRSTNDKRQQRAAAQRHRPRAAPLAPATSCSPRSRARSRRPRTNAGFATNTGSRRQHGARDRRARRRARSTRAARRCAPRSSGETSETAQEARRRGRSSAAPRSLLDDFDERRPRASPARDRALARDLPRAARGVPRAGAGAVAVLLNLVTVGAAVGVLILCFQTDPPPLGGPGYLDAIALRGIFAIIFGLSIDYEVFLMSRLVEGRALTGHDRRRDPLQPREDRRDHHRRGVHHGRRLPGVRGLAGHEHAPVRDRRDGRRAARRDGRAPDPAAGADQARSASARGGCRASCAAGASASRSQKRPRCPASTSRRATRRRRPSSSPPRSGGSRSRRRSAARRAAAGRREVRPVAPGCRPRR